jgi:hypothetical protein
MVRQRQRLSREDQEEEGLADPHTWMDDLLERRGERSKSKKSRGDKGRGWLAVARGGPCRHCSDSKRPRTHTRTGDEPRRGQSAPASPTDLAANGPGVYALEDESKAGAGKRADGLTDLERSAVHKLGEGVLDGCSACSACGRVDYSLWGSGSGSGSGRGG